MNLYEERDFIDDPAIAKWFTKHMMAMTEEDLLSKVAIAAELAYRDSEIEKLIMSLERLANEFDSKHSVVASRYVAERLLTLLG